MKEFMKQVHNLPFIAKLLLCIPMVDIFYSVCRIINGVVRNDVLRLVIGILTVIPGAFFVWIIDLVFVIWKGDAFFLDVAEE